MKLNKIMLAGALALGLAAPTFAGAPVPGPTKDDALAFGIGAVTEVALDATLPKSLSPNLRTFLIFAGSTVATAVVQAEKSQAQQRAFDNTELLYGTGGTLLAYQFHF